MNLDCLLPLIRQFISSLDSDPFLLEHAPILARRAERMQRMLKVESIPSLTVEEIRELFSDTDSILGVRVKVDSFLSSVLGEQNERAENVRVWLADLVRTAQVGLTPGGFNRLRDGLSGVGPSFLSELLMHRFPDRYWIWNSPIKQFIARMLGEGAVKERIPGGKKTDPGEEYFAAGVIIQEIKDCMRTAGSDNVDLIEVDLFMYWAKDRLPTVIHQPNTSAYTWKPIYVELARKLLEYEHRQDELIALLERLKEQGLAVMPLQDRDEEGDAIPLRAIDPFTFFASFNRQISDHNRKEILRRLKEAWNLRSPAPGDFQGVPVTNNQNSWFFPYFKERRDNDIPSLWRFAREIINREPEEVDQALFNEVLTISYTGIAKLTMGMFWMRPDTYFAVDRKNREIAERNGIRLTGSDASSYFRFLAEVKEKLGSDFAVISHNAHLQAVERSDAVASVEEPGVGYAGSVEDLSSDVERKLEALMADRELRYGWMRILADAVTVAAELSDVNWSLTFPRGGKYFRLNVAGVEVMALNAERVRLIVDAESLSAEVVERVHSTGGQVNSNSKWYTSVPGSKLRIDLPHSAIAFYTEFLRYSHLAYIRKASETRRGKSIWWSSHNSALVDYLNGVLNLELAQPLYLNEQQSDIPMLGRRIWLIAAGPGGSQWRDFMETGSVQVDYPGMGDFRSYESRDEMAKVLSNLLHDGGKNPFHDSLACTQFLNVMVAGDIVVAKEGVSTILGYGVVTGPYVYSGKDLNENYSHRRSVEWKKTGRWAVTRERKLVTKTLTDITEDHALVGHIEELLGQELKPMGTGADSSVAYWWLNCNPRVWNVGNLAVGEEHSYTAFNERGHKRRIFEYFEQVKPGDLMIGYETTPRRRVVALLRVTQSLTVSTDSREFTFEKVVDAGREVQWEELIADRVLVNAEPIRNSQGSLFRLTNTAFQRLCELAAFDVNEQKHKSPVPEDDAPFVSVEEVAENLFVGPELIERWSNAIRRKRQMVFFGPPGTGKTYAAREFARHLVGGGRGFVEVVQFHPSYSYEDFIQGIRPVTKPDGTLSYQTVPGVFMNFCEEASSLGTQDSCVLILDEINRANLSRVFGELMYLLEYRGESVRLAGNGREFRIPENVRIIGTMNTADRSIALVDHALRRRFAFVELRPEYAVLRSWHQLNRSGFSPDGLIETLQALNHAINDSHYEVGISFFLLQNLTDEIEHVWRMEIEPYLREYFFDRPDRATEFGWEKVAEKICK